MSNPREPIPRPRTIALIEPDGLRRRALRRRLQEHGSVAVASFATARTAFLFLLGRPDQIYRIVVNGDDGESLSWLEARVRMLPEALPIVRYASQDHDADVVRSLSGVTSRETR